MPDMTVRERLEEILAPTRQLLREVEEKIEQNRAEHTKLLGERNDLMKVVRAADPAVPRPGGVARKGGGGKKFMVSEQKVEALEQYLRANMDGETFHGSGISRRPDFDLMSAPTVAVALEMLAQRNVIRLDSIDRSRGGQKNFKLVRR